MSESRNRPPYNGERKGLAIAIDFGTTFSGVSYAFLEPGVPPKIRSVTGFKGQEDVDSSTKVPTVLVFDTTGAVRAAGPEAEDPDIVEKVENEGWNRVAWFKLLLRPQGKNKELDDAPCPNLPPGHSIETVLGEFLKYMNECAKSYIAKTHATGEKLWSEVEDRITYILSHPNGWHGFQQEKMRNAAIKGGLIPDTDDGKSRVHFVSEGEASFHWCVESDLAKDSLKPGKNVIVADAGGGTIDVSAFQVTKEEPLQLEETKPSESKLAGSIYVTDTFKKFATELLKNSIYSEPETIDRLTYEFDKKSKCLFRDDTRKTPIIFGGPRDTDKKLKIQSGKLILESEEMRPFFERSCVAAVDAIRSVIVGTDQTVVYLVGGFAASPYLYSEIQKRMKNSNVVIKRAESHTAKAVAEGAVGYFLDRYVTARVAKYTYGVMSSTEYDPILPDHRQRKEDVYLNPLIGCLMLVGHFSSHVEKGNVVKEASVSRIKLSRLISPGTEDEDVELRLFAYKGNVKNPGWLDQDPEGFEPACTFKARIPADCHSLCIAPIGVIFRTVDFEAVVSFGLTEFKCYLEWKDDEGTVKRGPMSSVWNEG